ncbi:NDP-sugar pyrophosphorylase family protein [Dysgonomonas sp. PH5-45]|uniref:nucleotidyltransferase family protein n=1 Tax=unclassified Dysgonomonas TaxID=2630389 RepID=UPI0024746992|nr:MULTISPECIES: sugar phosphate nucleotidyltransferase [unclassified Dysgonomonas]MDH6354913.1 NDP-sugar pyrophosphorylase family protein [Dysgonomonas sp. PH5-45]MDH6387812.1 NDP-sugar pyrophosphorylase family protein [Dysgonomonas sp. PH5-37]
MNYAIIAAGEGSRLAQEGVKLPKPLVKLNGTEMIARLVRIFSANNAKSISIIVNEEMTQVQEFVKQIELNIPLNLIVKSTPSSMHSFYELRNFLRNDKFCLTTVDTIFKEDDFGKYINAFISSEADGMMAVTDYIDDEKPLYVDVDREMNITGFLDQSDSCKYISGGIYGLTPKAIDTLEGCLQSGQSRMRNFQRQLVADGLRLKAHPFPKIVDVDHAGDIAKAEAFLNS